MGEDKKERKMKKSINIKGISTTSAYEDGDCMTLVNLRKKNGVMKPVTPRGTSQTLDNAYTYLFIHQLPQTGENLIGIRTIDSKIWICLVGTTETPLVETSGFKSITQIGNVLNVLDATGLKYLIWYDSAYKVISSESEVRVDLKADGARSNGNIKARQLGSDAMYGYDTTEEATGARTTRASACKGLSDKLLYSLRKDGLISGFITVCTAIELYDGSYILQSNPVLLGQANDVYARYKNLIVNGKTTNYIYPKAIIHPMPTGLTTNDDDTVDAEVITEEFKNYTTDLISVTENILPNMLCTWKHSGTIQEKIVVISGYNQLKFKIDSLIDPKYTSIIKSISVFATKEVSQYKDTRSDEYSFIGAARIVQDGLFSQDIENYLPVVKTDAEIIEELKTNQIFYKIHEIPFEDIVVGSTSATPVTAGQWVTMDIKGKLGDNLVNQDELPVDNFTHHTLVPNGQMVYNSKLHVWDYQQTLFKGWTLPELYAQQGTGQFAATGSTNEVEKSYSVVNIKTQTGVSKVITELDKSDWESLLFNPILSYPDSRATEITLYRGLGHKDLHECTVKNELSVTPLPNVSGNIIITAQSNVLVNVILEIIVIFHTGVDTFSSVTKTVTIPINTNTKTINVSEIEGITGDIEVIEINALTTQNDNINTYYSYFSGGLEVEGDKTTTLYDITIDTAQKKKFKLIPSESNNFAYYVSTDLKPISLDSAVVENTIPTEETPTLIYRNALKVSAINNPFYFPATQTHTIATGIILNVNTNALRMSEGQFGQYPLYVFTSEGIYSLDTGTTIAYNSQSPASTEIPTKNILCSTPFGVVFVGKRGAYVINGQQTELISAQLEQEPVVNTLNNVTIPSFLTFLATLKDILYDAVQNELIFVGTGTYNYVLNIDSKSFYLSTEKVDFEVKNANPLLKVADGLKIKDFSVAKTTSVTVGEVTTTTTDKANISLITRPIYFGIDEVKKMQRAILRGRIYGMTKTVTETLQAFISLWASNEGINFIMLRGITMSSANQNLNYKDIDMGLMARSTYRNYVVAVDAAVDEQTEIAYLDFEVADNYGNDKMR